MKISWVFHTSCFLSTSSRWQKASYLVFSRELTYRPPLPLRRERNPRLTVLSSSANQNDANNARSSIGRINTDKHVLSLNRVFYNCRSVLHKPPVLESLQRFDAGVFIMRTIKTRMMTIWIFNNRIKKIRKRRSRIMKTWIRNNKVIKIQTIASLTLGLSPSLSVSLYLSVSLSLTLNLKVRINKEVFMNWYYSEAEGPWAETDGFTYR